LEQAGLDGSGRYLDRLRHLSSDGGPAKVTARGLGELSLREAQPQVFTTLRDCYLEALHAAVDTRRYADRDGSDVSRGLRELADALGSSLAGPRDAVDLHTAALGHLARVRPPSGLAPFVEEGRAVLLELLGDLVSVYRRELALAERDGVM
jgi:hypothetical protein